MRAAVKKKEDHRKGAVLFLLVWVIAIALAGAIIYRRSQTRPFVYEEHLDDVLLSANGNEMTLREFGYYLREMEVFVQEQALLYDPEEPMKYWNVHFAAGYDSAFMFDYAKRRAVNNCLCDLIYASLAEQAGLAVDDWDRLLGRAAAQEIWAAMPEEVAKLLGLTREIVEETEIRKELVRRYVADYASRVDVSGYGGDPETVLSSGGDYFLEVILPAQQVTIDEALLEELRFGTITVNRRE